MIYTVHVCTHVVCQLLMSQCTKIRDRNVHVPVHERLCHASRHRLFVWVERMLLSSHMRRLRVAIKKIYFVSNFSGFLLVEILYRVEKYMHRHNLFMTTCLDLGYYTYLTFRFLGIRWASSNEVRPDPKHAELSL